MTARRRLLFLSQCLPYPPHSGVTNRTYNILRQLQQGFDVTLLAFSRRRHQPTAASRDAARAELARLLTSAAPAVPIPSEWSPARRVWDHLRSLATGRSWVYYEYADPRFARELATALERRPPDLIHIDSLDLFRWCDGLPDGLVTCTHHNIESDLLRRRAERTANPLLGRYIAHQAHLTERLEATWSPRFALNLMMSEIDAARLHALAPGARTAIVPNGVDVEAFTPTPAAEIVPGRVTFLGPLYMFANKEGVEFFLRESWPAILRAAPGATCEIVGHAAPADQAWCETHPAVRCAGYVPSIRPHLASAECCIVPLRVGGGTRLKILDYWAMGKAIVSTSVGCEGLEAVDGENILIRDTAEGFAEAVVEVLRDRALRERLERNARRTAEEVYSWDRIGAALRSQYQALLGGEPLPALAS